MASATEDPMPPRTRGTEEEPLIPEKFAPLTDDLPFDKASKPAPPPLLPEEEKKNVAYWQFRFHLAHVENGCLPEAEKLKNPIFSKYIDSILRTYFDAIRDRSGWGYYNIGWCYYYGIGLGSPDKTMAETHFHKSAALRNPMGQYALGKMFYEHGRYKDAVLMFERSTKNGCSYGELGLASCYFSGTGVSKSISKAYDYYRSAAEKGNKRAQYWLSILKDEFKISIGEARRLLELSRRNCYEPACEALRNEAK